MTNRIIFSIRTNGGVESLGGLALEQGDEVGAGSGPRPAEAAEEAQPGRGRCWSLGLRAGPQPAPAARGTWQGDQGHPVTPAVLVVCLLFHRMQPNAIQVLYINKYVHL